MADDDLDLRSVNWSQGMFLTRITFSAGTLLDRCFCGCCIRVADQRPLGGGPRGDARSAGAQVRPVV